MEDILTLKTLSEFVDGNTLVLLYMAVSIVRYILLPMYRQGKLLVSLANALKQALDEGVFGHKEIVAELRALNLVLSQVSPSSR